MPFGSAALLIWLGFACFPVARDTGPSKDADTDVDGDTDADTDADTDIDTDDTDIIDTDAQVIFDLVGTVTDDLDIDESFGWLNGESDCVMVRSWEDVDDAVDPGCTVCVVATVVYEEVVTTTCGSWYGTHNPGNRSIGLSATGQLWFFSPESLAWVQWGGVGTATATSYTGQGIFGDIFFDGYTQTQTIQFDWSFSR